MHTLGKLLVIWGTLELPMILPITSRTDQAIQNRRKVNRLPRDGFSCRAKGSMVLVWSEHLVQSLCDGGPVEPVFKRRAVGIRDPSPDMGG